MFVNFVNRTRTVIEWFFYFSLGRNAAIPRARILPVGKAETQEGRLCTSRERG